MKVLSPLSEHLIDIIQVARFAPSVHNTQPWKVSLNKDTITVRLDTAHTLAEGDPTGRQTIISLGIFCEAIDIAARTYGLRVVSTQLREDQVLLAFDTYKSDDLSGHKNVQLLQHRCSDRSVYSPVRLDELQLDQLRKLSNDSIKIWTTTDRKIITTVANLTSNAIGVALSSSSFRKELGHYLRMPFSKKRRGIDVFSLQINKIFALLQPLILKSGLSIGAEADLEKKRWLSASGLVIFTAKGDMPKFWFEVGKAYLKTSLELEALGFSQATSAGIVEASNYHEDVEQLLGTNERILALIRFGKGNKKRYYSPRISAKEIVT